MTLEAVHCLGLRAVRYGVGAAAGAHQTQATKDEANACLTCDPSKCIVCSRWVRACEEAQCSFAPTSSGRGFDSRVSPGQGLAFMGSECVSCGACVKGCFAWGYATHLDLLMAPRIRERISDSCSELSRDEAIAFAAARFKAIQA
ncbi:MAG: hypothetical protein ACKO3M_12975 [Rubrivivax sp.]